MRSAASRLGAALALALAAAGAEACDPCSGVLACRVGPEVSYSGRIIDFGSGHGVAGVRVVFHRVDGPTLAGDSLVAVTDADGRFQFRATLGAPGEVVGDVMVTPPAPRPPYTMRGVRMSATSVRGAGGVFDAWTAQPYVSWIVSVVNRRNGEPAAWSSAVFRRTGGARLAAGDMMYLPLDGGGYFLLETAALDTGVVVGNLTIGGALLGRPYVVEGVQIPVRVVDRWPTLDRTLRVGASVDYAVELQYRGTSSRVAGADVQFRRTGGIALQYDTASGRTGTDGRLLLSLRPAGEDPGEVVGDLTVRAPGLRRPFVVRGVHLRTFDVEDLRFGGVYAIGYAAQAAGFVVHRGDRMPVAAADVEFVRTGGLQTTPTSVKVRPRSDGWFGLALAADTVGEVAGDLTVRRDDGSAPTTFRGVRLRVADDDSVRFAGGFTVGAQLAYVGILTIRNTGAPAVDWTVTFRRTGGINLLSDTVTSRVLDWGGFGIGPATREEGTVEGTLTARSPSGDRTVTLGSVRLATVPDDSARLAGRWAVGPSLLYVGELRRDDTGAPVVGARAEFRRTGGIATAETVVGEPSNADGRFRMAPTPLASGVVVGDLYVFPPPPLRDTVFRDLRLTTFETDETRLYGVWRLAGPR